MQRINIQCLKFDFFLFSKSDKTDLLPYDLYVFITTQCSVVFNWFKFYVSNFLQSQFFLNLCQGYSIYIINLCMCSKDLVSLCCHIFIDIAIRVNEMVMRILTCGIWLQVVKMRSNLERFQMTKLRPFQEKVQRQYLSANVSPDSERGFMLVSMHWSEVPWSLMVAHLTPWLSCRLLATWRRCCKRPTINFTPGKPAGWWERPEGWTAYLTRDVDQL